MATGQAKARPRGRPRKYDADVRRTTLTFRVTGEMKARLEQRAAAFGRSLSEEVEHIVASYDDTLKSAVDRRKDPASIIASTIEASIRLSMLSSGSTSLNDPLTYDAVVAAIETTVGLLKRPEGASKEALMDDPWSLSLTDLHDADTDEDRRARRIGFAAAMEAVQWNKGDYSNSWTTTTLLTRGREGMPPGYEEARKLMKIQADRLSGVKAQD